MTPKAITSSILQFLFYILLQVLLLRNLVLFDVAFCFAYIAFILLLPFQINRVQLLIIAFVTGFIIDMFYNTLGLNAATTTLVAFLRPYVIRILTPQRGYDERSVLSLKGMGFSWFVTYATVLILIHHSLLFFVEASTWNLFFYTLLKVFASTFFTITLVILLQYFRKE